MVDNGDAVALMGNHEYNAILFNQLGDKGYLRSHSLKNIKQHASTMMQYSNQKAYDDDINWFKTLPLIYESEEFRACHASWDINSVEDLKEHTSDGVLSNELILKSANNDNPFHDSVEIICKGLEANLPEGEYFVDKGGHKRSEIRVKWWENPLGKSLTEMSVTKLDVDDAFVGSFESYPSGDKPVFFGHYWLSGLPQLLKPNVCCLDYSVAKDGYLTAYRFNGEQILSNDNFVFV
jgi:hypothetical protein